MANLKMIFGIRTALLCLLVLAACTKNPANQTAVHSVQNQNPAPESQTPALPSKPVNPLVDSHWQLVEFQSMDDAIGTQRPGTPSQYTLQLNADGSAQMKLNCNNATGSWSYSPSADGQSGQFGFSQMAVTMAVCPPPSMDEQISAQTQYISGYLLKDGNLHLSLMADGGIYVWEPSKASIQ